MKTKPFLKNLFPTTLIVLLALSTVFVSCSKDDDTDTIVSVASVSLNKSTTTIVIGDSETLTATVYPSTSTDTDVTWSSSDSNIVTVDSGVITAIALGEATITVTTVDGAKTATCEVVVTSEIAIADANLKSYLVSRFDTDGDGKISIIEAEAITSINCSNRSIKSLSGIENLINLTSLYCNNNQISDLDL